MPSNRLKPKPLTKDQQEKRDYIDEWRERAQSPRSHWIISDAISDNIRYTGFGRSASLSVLHLTPENLDAIEAEHVPILNEVTRKVSILTKAEAKEILKGG